MNFMERLEEGLSEESGDVLKHLRVSTYQKKSGDASESFLTDDSEMAKSTVVSNDDAIGVSINAAGSQQENKDALPGYSHIEDSYFQHAAPQDKPPVQAKPLNSFLNTIYENFFGSHITVTKLLNKDTNKEQIISKHCQKMGPIMLDINEGHLMDDWEQASRQEVADYKAGSSEVCINESWVKDPPNILIFTLQRVKYDKKALKLVKDFKKFQFEKVIYADQLLEGNIGRIDGVKERTRRIKDEIKALRAQLEACKSDTILNNLTQTVSFLQGQIASKNGEGAEEVKGDDHESSEVANR